jgi:polyphosphate kinase
MYRNLSKRVEVVTPIIAPSVKQRLWEILDICMHDQRQAWELHNGGTYTQLNPDTHTGREALGTHASLMELAERRLH